MTLRGARILAGLAVAMSALTLIAWADYRATRGELRSLLYAEADTLYATIAAAARVQDAAATAAERALGQRLLEHARLLAAMDRRTPLAADAVAGAAGTSDVFRVMVFDGAGRREFTAGDPPHGGGPGSNGPRGGRGRGAGWGGGPGPGGSRIAQRLVGGESEELVTAGHASRDGGERVAAGVRRTGGGAIVVNAASRVAQEHESVYSLDALASQIAGATPALGYIIFDEGEDHVARGPLAAAAVRERPTPAAGERTMLVVSGAAVFERRGAVSLEGPRQGQLRIGMRLDEVRRAEQRALARIAGTVTAVAALLVLATAFGTLRHRYGDLSLRHAHAQEALGRRDRLAAMGELASSVAHEIRNPLNAIAMSAQRLAREYPQLAHAGPGAGEEASELVDVIQREASRINATVQQFLDFARPRPINPTDVSVSILLQEVGAAATAAAALRGVTIRVEPAATLTLSADADQLRQALDNLLRNALDATPAGGTITLSAARRGRFVTITVADTGVGIAPDVLPRIFDLYYTTKRDGTGIGLAIVQQIVNSHGGTIVATSTQGVGTRMVIELPRDGGTRA